MRPAIIGMIFSAAWNIGKGASVSWPTPFIFLLVLLLLIRNKSQAVYLIPLSGLAGIVFYSF
jgi:chromate transporter